MAVPKFNLVLCAAFVHVSTTAANVAQYRWKLLGTSVRGLRL